MNRFFERSSFLQYCNMVSMAIPFLCMFSLQSSLGSEQEELIDQHEQSEKLSNLIFAQAGTMPILLVAGHGGSLEIPGVPERKHGSKMADLYTLELAQETSKALCTTTGLKPYVVAALFRRRYLDVNRMHPQNAYEHEKTEVLYTLYHRQIFDYITQIKKQFSKQHPLLIDIHGQKDSSNVIFRGTQNKRTVKELLATCGNQALIGPTSLLGALSTQGYSIHPSLSEQDEQENQNFNGGFTVANYGSQHEKGINAIQLEFGRDFRTADTVVQTAQDLAQAIAIFNKSYQGWAGDEFLTFFND